MGSKKSVQQLSTGIVVVGAVLLVAKIFGGQSPPDDLWFQSRVIERDDLVLVKFGAEWCPPCRAISPELDKLEDHTTGLDVIQIDVDKKSHLAQHYGVRNIPHLMLFKNGTVQATRGGYANEQTLKSWVRQYQ